MRKFNKHRTILLLILTISFNLWAQNIQNWVDYGNNAKLSLTANGRFEFSNNSYDVQGSYQIQNNVLLMQDAYGNNYQFIVQNNTNDSLILIDGNGKKYSYVLSNQINNKQSLQTNSSYNQVNNHNYPWDNPQYSRILASSNGYQWTESENQVYVEFLELLIGQNATDYEISAIRQDGINEFKDDPSMAIAEVQQVEEALSKIYSINGVMDIAVLREYIIAEFYKAVANEPEMNNYAFVKIVNQHVNVLYMDYNTNLSLSDQDVNSYINYLQFQAMLMGQNYQLSRQDVMNMQVLIVNQFPSLSLEQQQTLAFASFIWNAMEQEWNNMNTSEQSNYLTQMRQQMNIQNSSVQTINQDFWDDTNVLASYGIDINSINSQYNAAAAAQGVSLNQYIGQQYNSTAANQNFYNNLSNLSLGNHATMMNIANNIGGGDTYHYVDYGQ